MSILSDKRENLSSDNLKEMEKNQKLLQNRELMLRNFRTLIENLNECEKFIDDIINGKQVSDSDLCRTINRCLG